MCSRYDIGNTGQDTCPLLDVKDDFKRAAEMLYTVSQRTVWARQVDALLFFLVACLHSISFKMGKWGFFFCNGQYPIVFDAHLNFVTSVAKGKAQFAYIAMHVYLVERFLGYAIQEALGIAGQGALFTGESHPA